MSMFSLVYCVGQAAGVATCAMIIDSFGYRVVFGVVALALLALGSGAVSLLAQTSLGEGARHKPLR